MVGTTLLVDRSPPLSEIVDVTLKWSRNEYAEALLMALDPTAPATAREALAVLRQTLAGLGVAPGITPHATARACRATTIYRPTRWSRR